MADCNLVFSPIFIFEKDWRAHVFKGLTRGGLKILEFFGTFFLTQLDDFLKVLKNGDNVKISVHSVSFSFFVIVGNLRVFFYFFLFPPKLENANFECTWGWFFAIRTSTEGIFKGWKNTSIFADFHLHFRETFSDDRYLSIVSDQSSVNCWNWRFAAKGCLRCQKQFYSNRIFEEYNCDSFPLSDAFCTSHFFPLDYDLTTELFSILVEKTDHYRGVNDEWVRFGRSGGF